MKYRRLGPSGLYVSELALGAMTFGMPSWGCDEQTATQLIHRYLDAGGNIIDTASGYPGSEEICGRALHAKRDEVVLATKFGMATGTGVHARGAGRKHLKEVCETSLRRLHTDRIDLYWLHVDDFATPLVETFAALDDLIRDGKVLYTGVSNLRAYRVMKALGVCDRLGTGRPIAFQGEYNLIVRSLEREHLQLFAEEGLGLMSWSPLAAGMLTGKVRPGDTSETTRLAQHEVAFDAFHKNEHGFRVATVVQKAAAELGCTPAQLALAWQRYRPVTSIIIGARTPAQLEDNLASLQVKIPAEMLAELDQATALHGEYPGAFIDTFQQWFLKRGNDD
jgi:aryl-alcohol dehydrogenase-like predicted oxidoreductase